MEGDSIDLGFSVVDAYTGRIEAFADHVREHIRSNGRLLVVTQQAARLRELMEDRDLYPAAGLFVARQTELVPGLIVLGNQPVAQGFAIPSLDLEIYEGEGSGWLRNPENPNMKPGTARLIEFIKKHVS